MLIMTPILIGMILSGSMGLAIPCHKTKRRMIWLSGRTWLSGYWSRRRRHPSMFLGSDWWLWGEQSWRRKGCRARSGAQLQNIVGLDVQRCEQRGQVTEARICATDHERYRLVHIEHTPCLSHGPSAKESRQ